MPVQSAGILLFRKRDEVFLIHPGGPYWRRKDDGAWSVPKGIIDPGEEPLAAARREFREETGFTCAGETHFLGCFRQPSGKQLTAWAIEGDCDPSNLRSNWFSMPWPTRPGPSRSFPEADRGGWFGRAEARRKITVGQKPLLEAFYAWRDC